MTRRGELAASNEIPRPKEVERSSEDAMRKLPEVDASETLTAVLRIRPGCLTGTPLAFALHIAAFVYMLLVIAFVGARDAGNAVAGFTSVVVSLGCFAVLAFTGASTRLRILQSVLPIAAVLALSALTVAPAGFAKGPLAHIWSALHQSEVALPTQVHPNTIAYLLLPATVGSAALVMTRTGLRIVEGLSFLAGVLVLAIAGARTETAALLLGIGAAIVLSVPRRRRTLTLRIGIIAVALFTLVLAGRVLDEVTFQDRIRYWPDAASRLRESPWLGIGYGVIAFVNSDPARGSIHNTLLQACLDFGLAGASLLFASFLASIRASVHEVNAEDADARTLAVASAAALVSLAVAGLAESVVESPIQLADRFVTVVSPIPFVAAAMGLGQLRRKRRTRSVNAHDQVG